MGIGDGVTLSLLVEVALDFPPLASKTEAGCQDVEGGATPSAESVEEVEIDRLLPSLAPDGSLIVFMGRCVSSKSCLPLLLPPLPLVIPPALVAILLLVFLGIVRGGPIIVVGGFLRCTCPPDPPVGDEPEAFSERVPDESGPTADLCTPESCLSHANSLALADVDLSLRSEDECVGVSGKALSVPSSLSI
jgi:hypothetical protein